MPKAQALIAGASYDPPTLKILTSAFDEAWRGIAPNYESPLAIRAARLKLANVVLAIAAEGERDPAGLRDRATAALAVSV